MLIKVSNESLSQPSRMLSLPFLMTSDLELGVPEVSLVSGLERFGGVLTQEVIGALWEGSKLFGWEQF